MTCQRRALSILSILTILIFILNATGTAVFHDADSHVKSDSELRLVQMIWRHGDRNPEVTYETDPYAHPSFWPEGLGQLTHKGIQDHQALGRYLRKRYDGFVQPHFDPKEVHVLCSEVNRTIASAYSNLEGFFKIRKSHRHHGHNDNNLQQNADLSSSSDNLTNFSLTGTKFPFMLPLTLIPREKDNKIFQMAASCPKWEKLFKTALASDPEIVKIKQEYQWMFDYLTIHTGQVVDDFHKISIIYDILLIESYRNYTLPAWTSKVFPTAALTFLQAFAFKTTTFSSEMKRLRAGPLFKDIVTHMNHHITQQSGSKYRKMFVYSAHDLTITTILDLMGVFDLHRPPYASVVMFELRKNLTSGSFFVDVLYRNDSSREPYKLHPAGCPESSCDYSTFTTIFKKFIPGNWFKECSL